MLGIQQPIELLPLVSCCLLVVGFANAILFSFLVILFATELRCSLVDLHMGHWVTLFGFAAIHTYQLVNLALLPLLFLYNLCDNHLAVFCP